MQHDEHDSTCSTIERGNFKGGVKNSQIIVGKNWGSLVLIQLTSVLISSRIDAHKYRLISISSWLLTLCNKRRIIVEVQCSTKVSY